MNALAPDFLFERSPEFLRRVDEESARDDAYEALVARDEAARAQRRAYELSDVYQADKAARAQRCLAHRERIDRELAAIEERWRVKTPKEIAAKEAEIERGAAALDDAFAATLPPNLRVDFDRIRALPTGVEWKTAVESFSAKLPLSLWGILRWRTSCTARTDGFIESRQSRKNWSHR